jgi:signal transduction histidine kinase
MQRHMIRIDETNILYTISNKLTQASTPAEWLEAVSDYARQRGAISGVLLYVEHDLRGQPEYMETTAVWVRDGAKASSVGSRLSIVDRDESADHWMGNRERLLFFTDVQADGAFRGAKRDFFADPAIRGVALLPLNIKGRWIGTLTFNWNEPVFFDESDQRIFTAIIQLAAPVIDSMRLYERSRERAARAEHLLAVNMALSQATNDSEILAALALYSDKDHPDGLTLSYLMLDETGKPVESTTMAVWRDGPIPIGDPRVNHTFDLSGSRLAAFLRTHPDQVLFVEDFTTDTRIDAASKKMMARFGVGAVALIPLYSYGRWQGLASVEWNKLHIFTGEEKYIYNALMQTLPSVVASRRAYLAAEEARQERELLYDASKGINAARTYQEIVEALECLNMNSLSIGLWVWEHFDFRSATFITLAAQAQGSHWQPDVQLPIESGPLVPNIDLNQLVIVENTADHPPITTTRSLVDTVAALMADEYGSMLAVPLGLHDRFMGLLCFESEAPRSFIAREKQLVAGIGELVSAAVERLRLKEETERLNQKAQKMAALEERNRLARELHDSVSQALYGIALGTRTAQTLLRRDPVQAAEPLDYVLSLAEAGLSEMRALIFELRPELLENEGLTIALKSQVSSLEMSHHLQVQTELCEEPALPVEAKEALYRITREVLFNIAKHAQASHVKLSMACCEESVRLEISDDGVGFDPHALFPGHLGLQSIRERAGRLDGTVEIDSAPGQGTCVRVFLPVGSNGVLPRKL